MSHGCNQTVAFQGRGNDGRRALMLGQHFPALSAAPTDLFGPLEGGERMLWRGRAGVAEYAFDQAASLPRWTLPETTEVLITNRRVVYAYASDENELQITSGELRWLWPQHLRVQPGARTSDRGGAATQIQLVCGSADGSFPALVFAGGDLATVGDADRLANLLRQAIARFRVDNAQKLGLSTPQSRILSRLLIGPEFSNYQGGEGQTVSLQGALLVSRREPIAPGPDAEPRPDPARPRLSDEGTRLLNFRPGIEQDAARAWAAARAEKAAQQAEPDLASRASALAARVADLVSQSRSPDRAEAEPAQSEPAQFEPAQAEPAQAEWTQPEPARPEWAQYEQDEADRVAGFDVPTADLTERAEALRRSAARFAANSARGRVGARRPDREAGVSTRGNRNG
jgi:hypothetical protein